MTARKSTLILPRSKERVSDLTVAGHTVVASDLADFCQRHAIRWLALFGSVLRPDFRPDSDVDVLVEFEPGRTPDFFSLYELEEELSALLGGHRLDLVTVPALNPHLRSSVLASAKVIYEQG